jgi:hypothetical protein
MTSPRGEAIKKSHSDDVSIAAPIEGDEAANKIDHYGVLGRIISGGVASFLADEQAIPSLSQSSSIMELSKAMRASLVASIFQTATTPKNTEGYANLSTSQKQRNTINDERHSRIEGNLEAGVETFTSIFLSLVKILDKEYGRTAAVHPDNWRIPDRLAKLHIELFSPYVTTYLHTPENTPKLLEQLEPSSQGGLQFSTHFPRKAEVSVWTTRHRYRPLLARDDIVLHDEQETIRLEDIKLDNPELGCPVTFEADAVKELWRVFSEAAAAIPIWEDQKITLARQALQRALKSIPDAPDEEFSVDETTDDSEASRQ